MPHEVSAAHHNQSKPENIFTELVDFGIVDSGIIFAPKTSFEAPL
jgi:hypothetical protein